MSITSKPWSRLWLLIALPFGLYALFSIVAGGGYALAVMGDNYMSDHTLYSDSRADAKANGVFMDTVIVEPRVVKYQGYEVSFENCWLEQLRESHRPSWDARREITKQPRAIFHLNYRATYNRRPIIDSNKAPVLSGQDINGGDFLGQEPRQQLEAYVDLWPDNTLKLELPLHLSLQQGPDSATMLGFIAYPGRAK